MALTLLGQLKLFTIAPGNMCPAALEAAALLIAYCTDKKTGGDKPCPYRSQNHPWHYVSVLTRRLLLQTMTKHCCTVVRR